MNRTFQGKWLSLAIVIACGATGLVACASSDAPTDINPQPLPPIPPEGDQRGPTDDGTNKEGASSGGGGTSSGTQASSDADADAGTDGSKDQ